MIEYTNNNNNNNKIIFYMIYDHKAEYIYIFIYI